MTTRILIVDDHPATRHGLALLIGKEPDLVACGEAGDRDEALAAIRRDPPDFVVLDLALRKDAATGLDLIAEIHAQAGPVPILIYSMYDDILYAERALRAGARGYLTKQEPIRAIIKAIRAILAGGVYVCDAVNQKLLNRSVGHPAADPDPDAPLAGLSDREFEVFRLVGKGYQPREIARMIRLSVKTVESHRLNIRKKLGVANAAELHRFAVEWVHRKT